MQFDSCDEWVDELDTNAHGRKILTFSNALQLASNGCSSGWFVAPYATYWAIGREADDGERYYLLRPSGEPVVFESRQDARRFLEALLEPSEDCAGGLEEWARGVAGSFLAAMPPVNSRHQAIARHAARPA